MTCTLLLVLCGCANSPGNVAPTDRESNLHFSIVPIGAVQESVLTRVSTRLEERRSQIMAALSVAELPTIRVKVWADRTAFERTFVSGGGTGGVASGYVNAALMEIRILAGPDSEATATHELAHIVSLSINPTIAANPFWLWEAAALYADGESPSDTQELSCLSGSRGPTLNELNQYPANTKIFHLGYLIAEYISDRWGREVLVSLIRSNGDIEEILGLSEQEFESDWYAHVLANYDFEPPGQPMTKAELLASFSGNTLVQEESGLITLLAEDGSFSYGRHGQVLDIGRWAVSESNEICLDFDGAEARCSQWFKKDESTYLLASQSDCVYGEWKLRNAQ